MSFVQRRPQRGEKLQPLDTIEGFQVRPGFYTRDGAAAAQNGVSFTIHSVGATSCTLLLFHPQEKEPYAKLKSRNLIASEIPIPCWYSDWILRNLSMPLK